MAAGLEGPHPTLPLLRTILNTAVDDYLARPPGPHERRGRSAATVNRPALVAALTGDARPATGLETVIIVAVPARRTIGRRGASGFCTASTGGYPGSLAARTSTGSITGGRASSSDAWAISAAAT